MFKFFEYNGLTQLVTVPTWKNNILDLLWTNVFELYEAVVVSKPIANGNHNAVCATVITNHYPTNTKSGKFRFAQDAFT